MLYRAFRSDESLEDRRFFTKMSDCDAVLDIEFWGSVDVKRMKIKSVVTEITFPNEKSHNHSLDEFSISACETYHEVRAYIDTCVNRGMGHHNTFIQVRKFAREVLVPKIEKDIGKKINISDTRFFPTRRTVYTY